MEEASDPNSPQAPSIEELAPLFPAYEFQQFIAEGGMGAVYLARQISLDRPVAIKILSRELGDDPEFRASFEAEAKAMARLNHPNLIGVYDFGDADGMPFIVMEMVNGKSLHHSAYGRSIDPVQAGTLVAKISRGLEHAHSAGILHRDIKPGNILLDADANPKIGDFGLATPMDQKTSGDETIYGTPGYTAPEVYQRKGDHRADIFSVGILLHELLTGKLPDGSGTPPSMLCGCSRAFDSIVARATNPNPTMRFADAGELAEELEKAVLEGDAADASTNRLVLPSKAPAAAAPRATAAPSPVQAKLKAQVAAQSQQKSPALMIGIVCAVLGLILIVILAGAGGDDDAESAARASAASREKAERAERERQAQRERARAKAERERNRRADRRDEIAKGDRPVKPDRGDTSESPAKPSKPSPLAALAELKEKLAGGGREQFPPGTEARAGSRFLLVDRPMSWTQAKAFAEDHGAHLAVLPSVADRSWFRQKFPSENGVWLGGGIAAADQWQWIDGSQWAGAGGALEATPGNQVIALDPKGALRAGADAEQLHFAIQWRDDASNPGTTGAQLKRTAAAIESRGLDLAPFPVGTRSYTAANSHFFIVPKAVSWDAARQLANAAGGYLAVPSSQAESEWIRSTFSDPATAKLSPVWIGGYRLKAGDPWSWLTREAWNYDAGWAGGSAPTGGAPGRLALKFDSGWVANDGGDGAALGMLIEWSPPKKAATISSFDLDGWLAKTDSRFAEIVQRDIDDYAKEREAVLDRYVRNIERLGRKAASAAKGFDGKGKLSDEVRGAVNAAVRQVEKEGKLLAEMPDGAPGEFHELQTKSEESLKENDEAFMKKMGAHLANYKAGMTKQASVLAENGFDSASAALGERVAGLEDDDGVKLIALLQLQDPIPRPPAPEKEEGEDGKAGEGDEKKPAAGEAPDGGGT